PFVTLSTRRCSFRRSRCRFMYSAEQESSTNAHVDDKGTWRAAIVSRNDRLTRQWSKIEVTKPRAFDLTSRIVAIGIWTSKARAFIVLAVKVQILTGCNVERRTSIRRDKWIN